MQLFILSKKLCYPFSLVSNAKNIEILQLNIKSIQTEAKHTVNSFYSYLAFQIIPSLVATKILCK